MPPVVEQPRRPRSDPPVVAVWQLSPAVDLLADQIDKRGVIVLLLRRREPLALVKRKGRLLGCTLPLPGLWDRRDELCAPARLNNLVSRLAVLVQLPMTRGILV